MRAALVIAFSAFVILTWLPRAFAGRWIADDYCFAVSSVRDGFWHSQELLYMTAGGRYSVNFLCAALTRLGTWTPPFLAIGAMLIWLTASWRAAAGAFRSLNAGATRFEEFAAGAGLVAAVLNAAPDIYQPLIWTVGLFIYGLPVIGATVMAAVILRRIEWSGPSHTNDRSFAIAMAIAAFVLGGCSEVAAVAQIIVAVAVAIVSRRVRPVLIVVAIGSALALLAVAIAPGNFQRRQLFLPLTIPDAFRVALMVTPRAVMAMLVQGYSLFLPLVAFVALAGNNPAPARRATAGAMAFAGVVTVTATMFGGLVGTGRLPWGRVQFVSVACITLAVTSIGFVLRRPAFQRPVIANALTVVMGIVGLASCIVTADTRVQSIREARQFAAAADRVELMSRSHRGEALVVHAPGTFELLEYVTAEPGHWSNHCIAEYYGLQSIRSGVLLPR